MTNPADPDGYLALLQHISAKVDAIDSKYQKTEIDVAVIKAKLDRPGPNWPSVISALTGAATLLIFITNYGLPIAK